MPSSPHHTTSKLAAPTPANALQQRWDRIGLGIRCAYNPEQPAAIWQYLAVGTRLAHTGQVPPAVAFERMLKVLLQAAADEGLPWFWRSVCLEHTALPLARLVFLLRTHDPAKVETLQAAVTAVHEQVGQNRSGRRVAS